MAHAGMGLDSGGSGISGLIGHSEFARLYDGRNCLLRFRHVPTVVALAWCKRSAAACLEVRC